MGVAADVDAAVQAAKASFPAWAKPACAPRTGDIQIS